MHTVNFAANVCSIARRTRRRPYSARSWPARRWIARSRSRRCRSDGLAAQISVPLPFTPVPFTLQPMVVLLGGAALGARLGMASQVLHLALGIAGFPVFAASAVLPQGALRLLGPTGGYLMSYPFAAFVAGALAELRSALFHVGPRDGRRSRRRVHLWRALARVVRTPCSQRLSAPRCALVSIRSFPPTSSRSASPRPCRVCGR